jgi:hypothetical protein
VPKSERLVPIRERRVRKKKLAKYVGSIDRPKQQQVTNLPEVTAHQVLHPLRAEAMAEEAHLEDVSQNRVTIKSPQEDRAQIPVEETGEFRHYRLQIESCGHTELRFCI